MKKCQAPPTIMGVCPPRSRRLFPKTAGANADGAQRTLNTASQECGFVREAKRTPALPYAPEVTLQPHIHTLHTYICAYIHTLHSIYIHVCVQYTAQRNCIGIEKNPLHPCVLYSGIYRSKRVERVPVPFIQ